VPCRHDQAENPATIKQHEAGRMANTGKLVSTAALKRDADRLYAQGPPDGRRALSLPCVA